MGRYPAVASEPVDHEANSSDFKTAYRESIHFVRYRQFPPDFSVKFFYADPLSDTPINKFCFLFSLLLCRLIRLRFLKHEDAQNTDKVAEATKQFEQAYDQPIS